MAEAARCSICGSTFDTNEQLRAHMGTAHPERSGKPRWPPSVSRGRFLRWGALGGFLGGIALALVMLAAGQALLGDGVAVVCSMGVALIGLQATSTPTTILGLGIHFTVAIVIGVVLAAVALLLRGRFAGRFAITTVRNGAGFGLLGGFLVWLVFGLPLMTFALAPAMVQVMGMMMPGNMMMGEEEARAALGGAGFIGAWFGGHLLFGLIWGATTGFGAARKTTAAKSVAADLGTPR
jgi:hypothetical protein